MFVHVPNFKSLGQLVAEKSLTKKKVYTQTHTWKKQKLYNPYILLIPGGINNENVILLCGKFFQIKLFALNMLCVT